MPAHPHAALMLQYAQDAAETDKPWERWEARLRGHSDWIALDSTPLWLDWQEYRRKPKTIKVNGFDVPEPLKAATARQKVWLAMCTHAEFADWYHFCVEEAWKPRALKRGLFHATKEAAVVHAKAMLGIDPNEGE